MGFRGIARATLIGTAALALGSLPAAAQTVTFSTTGAFSGACTGTSCAFGAFTLSFTPVGSNAFFSGSTVDLGSFNTACTGCAAGVAETSFPSGVVFTLTVSQTGPSNGSNQFAGSATGTLAFDPSFSSLIWMPAPGGFNIGNAHYQVITDNTGNINVAPPTATGGNPNATVVKAVVTTATTTTTTPEPSAVALMATGMFGLIPLARRRRK
jgi:hypothetical protein